MLLRCIAETPSAEQRKLLGDLYRPDGSFHVRQGEEYVAFGLEITDRVIWVDIVENDRTVIPVPLFLFEVLDGRISQFWSARRAEMDGLTIWPELFYERAFHDRLSNGEPKLIDQFVALRRAMEAEAR